MMEWYYAWPKEHGIREKAGLGDRRGMYLMSGFWMRRMHDGTDGICFKYLTKILRAYDKSFAGAHLR